MKENKTTLKKNNEYEVTIEDIGNDGEGICHIDDMAVFVKDTLIGDVAKIKIIKVNKRYAYGKLIDLITPSDIRIEPPCKVAGPCGGCSIQHMDYQKQLEWKQNKVLNCLQRIGGFQNVAQMMEPIVGMETPFHYRNKAQFPIGFKKDDSPAIGFYAGRTHVIVDYENCLLQAEEINFIVEKLRLFIKEHHLSVYEETTHTGLLRHVLIRISKQTKEIMVCLVLNGTKLTKEQTFIDTFKDIQGMTSLCLNYNTEKTNRILGQTSRTIWGKDYITDYIGETRYQISPLSFYQVNPEQTKKIYEKVLEYADFTKKETVWDLYCGIGTISLFLAKQAEKVFGVEVIPEAIADAKNNAKINGIENVTFFVGKAEEVLPREYKKHGIYADVIVVDPPRKGCDRITLDTMLNMQPKKIVYVSCDPATLARDLKILCEKEYRLEKVCAIDQFCHTVHVETCVLLSHKKPDSYINVKVEFGEEEGQVSLKEISERAEEYKPKERVTYKMIQEYVENKYGFKVHTAYIAEVKRSLGLPMYDAPNAVEELKTSRSHPTPEKVQAIKDALKHFNLL